MLKLPRREIVSGLASTRTMCVLMLVPMETTSQRMAAVKHVSTIASMLWNRATVVVHKQMTNPGNSQIEGNMAEGQSLCLPLYRA
jgi:hypothetical protein